jgi:beta-galactosidase
VVDRLLAESGVGPVAAADPGVELTRRRAADGSSYLFAINHTREAASVRAAGTDVLTGEAFAGSVGAGLVAVIAED